MLKEKLEASADYLRKRLRQRSACESKTAHIRLVELEIDSEGSIKTDKTGSYITTYYLKQLLRKVCEAHRR